jgi:hypothetical protein
MTHLQTTSQQSRGAAFHRHISRMARLGSRPNFERHFARNLLLDYFLLVLGFWPVNDIRMASMRSPVNIETELLIQNDLAGA